MSRTIAERHRVIEEDAAGHGYLLAYLYLLAGDLDAVYAVMEADLAGDRLLRWRHYAGLDPLRTQARFVELTARAEK